MRKLIETARIGFLVLRSQVYKLYFRTVYGVRFGKSVRMLSRMLIYGPGRVVIGEGTTFGSRRTVNEICTVSEQAVVTIGKECFLNGAVIGAKASIEIGDRCVIAEAYIRDTSSHGIDPARRRDPDAAVTAPVVLEENVWIGSHSHVMPGVRIGKNSIIGVNSVVTKSIPANVFAAGIPATVIRSIGEESKD